MAHTLSAVKGNLMMVCKLHFGLHRADKWSQGDWFEARRKIQLAEEVQRTFEGATG